MTDPSPPSHLHLVLRRGLMDDDRRVCLSQLEEQGLTMRRIFDYEDPSLVRDPNSLGGRQDQDPVTIISQECGAEEKEVSVSPVLGTSYLARNHLYDIYLATLTYPNLISPSSNQQVSRKVVVQLTSPQSFPDSSPRFRPAYCDQLERFSSTQAEIAVERESWFYQRYGPIIRRYEDIIPDHLGTYHARVPTREGSSVNVDLYALVVVDPGELLGDGWDSIHHSTVDTDIWLKVYDAYDLLHHKNIIHNTELVALNIFYDKQKDKVRISNFYDVLVDDDGAQPGKESQDIRRMKLRGEKARIERCRRGIAARRGRELQGGHGEI
ncbi:hypothetical protein I302_106643 [Kwoniella bestiolae CBS 10118]|uniref:Protein kinase domain-containing protein n=1 Tax=Kwoniella bestiolae CBS 10118 TaxID=1296100 RepID=A0A1B9G0S8_9TREE|nr:hypothetical protein I302_06095 [Kwoniella bestiolae CBS 10118]OCF24634.1 hypothetical protein I302_06095 [Kwoniella bestiolae CBS 10118]